MRSIPAFREPAPRIELMDEQGIDRALMFPTLASLIEERMRDDPAMCHAVIHSLNQWIHETWQFDYEGRIFATPVITLPDRRQGLEELEWVVERGAKAVLIRPAPAWGYQGPRSPGLPEFDPVWEKVVEPTCSSACTPPTAATSATPTSGWAATARCSRSSPRRSGCSASGGPSRTPSRP